MMSGAALTPAALGEEAGASGAPETLDRVVVTATRLEADDPHQADKLRRVTAAQSELRRLRDEAYVEVRLQPSAAATEAPTTAVQ